MLFFQTSRWSVIINNTSSHGEVIINNTSSHGEVIINNTLSQVDAATNCQKLKSELVELHQSRDKMIETCLEFQRNLLATASDERSRRSAQRTVRSLQQEVNVEAIVRERSNAFFKNKCNPFMDFDAKLQQKERQFELLSPSVVFKFDLLVDI